MNILKYTAALVLLLSSGLTASRAQHQSQASRYDTIPFEVVHGKIIVPARIGGRPTKFILDTGGRNLMTSDSARYHGAELTGQHSVSDVNSGNLGMNTASVGNLSIGRLMNWEAASFLVTAPNNFFRELGVAGLLGGEAFAHVCIVLDMRSREMVVCHPYRPPGLSRADAIQMSLTNNFHTYVPLTTGTKQLSVLFDTGMDGFFGISESDYEKLDSPSDASVEADGRGFLYVGIGGIKAAKPEKIVRARIPRISFGGKEFTNVLTTTQRRNYSLLGIGTLDYGKVVIDYPRGLLYFIPYDEGPSDMYDETKMWNVKILPVGDHFEITAVIGDAGVEIGERVWEIDGKSLEDAAPSELLINGMFDSVEGDNCVIRVGADMNNLRDVKISKI